MDEANAFPSTQVSTGVVWRRLAPLLVFIYQVVVLFALVVALLLAFTWFGQPSLGMYFDPGMVIGNVQQPHFQWEQQAYYPGVTVQDVLISINGQTVQSASDLQSVLSGYQVGDVVALGFRARSGHTSNHSITLTQSSSYERIMYFYLPFGAAIFFLGAGMWVLRARADDPAARSFAILAASLALLLGAWFDVWTTHRLVPIWLVAAGLAAGAVVHFTLLFPAAYAAVQRFPIARFAGYLIGLGFAAVPLSVVFNPGNPFEIGSAWTRLFQFTAFAFFFFFVNLAFRRFITKSPVELEQIRIVTWGSALALVPISIYQLGHITSWAFLEIPLIVVVAPLVLFPLSIAYAIIRYRVVNTDFIISRVFMYIILTLLSGLGYAAVVSGISLLFRDIISVSSPFLIGVMVFVFALLINPFRTQVQNLVDSLFYRGGSLYQQQIEAFTNDLRQAVELSRVAALLREYINQNLAPVRLHIFVYDALVDRYEAAYGADERSTTDIRFPPNSGLVHSLSSKRTTLFLDEEQMLSAELDHERPRLALLGAQLFIAMHGQERLSGWLALGPRNSGEKYTAQDLEFLTALANQAAAAIDRAQVMADKDRRVHEMNVLTRVAQGVNVTLAFDDILELLHAQTRQVIPVDDFNITLYNATTQLLRHVFWVQGDQRMTELEEEVIPLSYGLEREVLQNRRYIITDDYQQECRNRRIYPNKKNVFAWMGVPLNAGAETIGVIAVGSSNPAIIYTEDQYNFLQAIADQAAGAIVKARLLQESETRARQLASLNEITRGLTSTLELDPLLKNVMHSAVEILNCEAGSLLLVDQQAKELVYEVVVGPVADQFLGDRHPIDVGLAGKAASTMQPLIVNNVEQNPDWHAQSDQETGFVTHGMLVVPMIYKGGVVGVLEVLNKKDGMPFTRDDQELLNAFAGQAAVAVENVRLYTQTDQALSSRVEELSVMQRIDRELNTSLEVSTAMSITLEWAMRQSNSLAGLVGVVEKDGLRVMASQGFEHQLDRYTEGVLPLDLPLLAAAVAEGRLQQTGEADEKHTCLHEHASRQLVIPIRREVEVIGLLLLESEAVTPYEEQTVDFLTRLSDHASIAISNAQLYAEVQHANLAKSEFVSFVSHELKTPMTSIRGYADLLAAGSVGEVTGPQMEFINTIRSNIQRMATLVSDLADISRIEAGRLHLEFAPVSIADVVEEVVRSTRALVEEKSHQLVVELPDELPQAWGDRNRLVQIITNMTSNAIKYTPENGEIIIRAAQTQNQWDTEGAPQVIHIEVVDSGIGIKEEDQHRIFQQYFRTEEGKETAPGTGLGLNITRYLVEMQGGKVWFESEFGQGSNFQFTVPVAEGVRE